MITTPPKTLTPEQLTAVLANDLANERVAAEWRLHQAWNYLSGVFGPYAKQRCTTCAETFPISELTSTWENQHVGFRWECGCRNKQPDPPTDTTPSTLDAHSASEAAE
jgi:hypothetical protein